MNATPEQVIAGQAIYTDDTLKAYDFVVLTVSNRFIWKCPTQRLVEHYNEHITANHLDVGVGTGYFLDHCRFPVPAPRIALMDLNQHALDFTSDRIARYKPESYRCNILEPIQIEAPKFDSIGINYLLHCVPGSIESKTMAFDHLKKLMNPNAVLFGSTILHGGVTPNWPAKKLMQLYNKKGIFSNQQDDLNGLTNALNTRFRDVTIKIIGCVALFSGRTSD